MQLAEGELERLGIVSVDPFDLNGQSKLYARFIKKCLSEVELNSFFSKFGPVNELFTFRDDCGNFNGTCFVKFEARKSAIEAICLLNHKCADYETAQIFDKSCSRETRGRSYNSLVA